MATKDIKKIKDIILKLHNNKRNNQITAIIAKKIFNLKKGNKPTYLKIKGYEFIEEDING